MELSLPLKTMKNNSSSKDLKEKALGPFKMILSQ